MRAFNVEICRGHFPLPGRRAETEPKSGFTSDVSNRPRYAPTTHHSEENIMSNDAVEPEKLTMTNTKKEMLQAYQRLLKQLQEKQRAEMKPAETLAERKKAKAVAIAAATSTDNVGNQIASLKSEIGRTLNELAERLEQETAKYAQVKTAVDAAEAELQEIYEIEKVAGSLAALLEAQRQQREEFEAEMGAKREELEGEIVTHHEAFDYEVKTQREQWKKEKAEHEAAAKEQDAAEKKRRQREHEEWQYQFQREKQAAEEQRQHELARLDREIQLKTEQLEKVLAEREQAVAAAEAELQALRARAEDFPAELDQAVSRAVQETTQRLERERKYAVDLLQKEFDGDRNVLNSRIEALQATVEKQTEQIARSSQQLEHSYGQVQDIALKAIEGSSLSRSAAPAAAPPAPDRVPRAPQNE
jgi:hypothetical protein